MIITTRTTQNIVALVTDVATASIVAVNQDTKTITADGDISGFILPESRINISGSTGNDKTDITVGYTVVEVTVTGGDTEITVKEDIPDNTADGDVEYYNSVDYINDTFLAEGNITADMTSGVIIEIVNPDNMILSSEAYVVSSSALESGNTRITISGDVPIATMTNGNGFVQYFTGSTSGYFMVKGIGTRAYTLLPQGVAQIGKRGLFGSTIFLALASENIEFNIPFADLADPNESNVDAAEDAIIAIANP